jgi:Uma2 family endonuclease
MQRAGGVSVEDYLEGEQRSELRHEYFAGQTVAMAGASRKHGLAAMGLALAIGFAARRKGCQLFIADMKVRIEHEGEDFFYYPDLVLTCDTNDREALYCAAPCLIVEVLSPSTERIDRREKRLAYALLPSLLEYVLVDPEALKIEIYQRIEPGVAGPFGWRHEVVVDGTFRLACLDVEVAVTDVFADLMV